MDVTNNRRAPPRRGNMGISSGRVLNSLVQCLRSKEGFQEEECAAYRLDLLRGIYVPRVFLTPEQAVAVLKQADVTMYELFSCAGYNIFLGHDDGLMHIFVNRLDEEALGRVLAVIRECQNPWWLPLMGGSPVPVAERLQKIVRHRLGCCNGGKVLEQRYPMLHKYTPFSKVSFVRTDDLPDLAEELDVHMSALTDLDCTIPWFSDWPAAERVCAEYHMLNKPMRSVVLRYTKQIMEDYFHEGKLYGREWSG